MKGLGKQELGGWISMAHDHWTEHRPKMYRALLKSGKLPERLEEAAKQTALEMDQLMNAGYTHHQSWEAVRQTYLILPQEEEVEEPVEPSEGYKLLTELTHLRMKVNEELNRIASEGN
jgi:hypothetical protein